MKRLNDCKHGFIERTCELCNKKQVVLDRNITTTCDRCENKILRSTAVKVPIGQGCHDYFCNEKCANEYQEWGAK